MSLQSVIFFGAHPDDELYVGGILSMLSGRGVAVHLVCATRGEGGPLGEPPVERAQLGALRVCEATCAAQALGAASLDWLGYIDPVMQPVEGGGGHTLYAFDADLDRFAGQCIDLIRAYNADLVLTHGVNGEYHHPGHQLVHRGVRRAIGRLTDAPLLYTVEARVPEIADHHWNESERAHFVLDVSAWFDRKKRALLCHRSQVPAIMRFYGCEDVNGAVDRIESVHRYHPPVGPGEWPDDAFAAALLEAGAWRPEPT